MGTKSGWLLLTRVSPMTPCMVAHVVAARSSLRLLLECSGPPQSCTRSSFLFVVGGVFSHSVNSRPTRSSPMYPAYRSYPQPVQPVHPDRRGMFYRFYDRYRIFNDRRTRPFPFRFYCESFAFSTNYKRYNRIKKKKKQDTNCNPYSTLHLIHLEKELNLCTLSK